MKRICVIGNSHVSMLAAASRERSENVSFTFFAKPKLAIDDFVLDGTTLRGNGDRMTKWLDRFCADPVLDLAGFDTIVVVGLTASVFPAMRVAQTHLVTGWPSLSPRLASILDGTRQWPTRPLLTRTTYRTILRCLNDQRLGYQLATKIRVDCDQPCLLYTSPSPRDA